MLWLLWRKYIPGTTVLIGKMNEIFEEFSPSLMLKNGKMKFLK